jgi:hypothetical protein
MDAADEAMPRPTVANLAMDVFDVLQRHRQELIEEKREGAQDNGDQPPLDPANSFPKELRRR